MTVGNLIQSADQANVTLLTTIVSVDPVYASFDVDEPTVQRVRQWFRKGKAEPGPDAALPGAGGTQTFVVRALAAGTTTLVLAYARPFEKGKPPARKAEFTIVVR